MAGWTKEQGHHFVELCQNRTMILETLVYLESIKPSRKTFYPKEIARLLLFKYSDEGVMALESWLKRGPGVYMWSPLNKLLQQGKVYCSSSGSLYGLVKKEKS